MKQGTVFSKMRDILAIDAAKAVASGSRLAGNQGTSFPGKMAMKIAPSVLADLAGQIRKTTFAVCGTNGKTTTNNLLCAMLEADGSRVVCNRLGANMLPGIAGAYVREAGGNGRLEAEYACIEVDEASAQHVFRHVKPDYLILTNLFRDQLDRYGEIDITIGLLKQAIQLVPDMKLIVNADDPFSVYLAEETGNPVVFYGIPGPIAAQRRSGEAALDNAKHMQENGAVMSDETEHREKTDGETAKNGRRENRPDTTGEIRESGFCKVCGAPLIYDFYHFSQVGMYRCSSCSFKRPDAAYEAADIRLADGVSFSVDSCRVESNLAGAYSVYNLLAVWSALRESESRLLIQNNPPQQDGQEETEKNASSQTSGGHHGERQKTSGGSELTASGFNEVLSRYRAQFGRNEHFRVNGREVVLNLAKNPAGFNQNIGAMLEDTAPKDLLIVINDNDQDGTDVSWLWDVDFDRIRDDSVHSVTVSGIRGLDMGLRLKYVEIDAEITGTPEEALEKLLREKRQEKLYVLVNYTALFSIHQYLLKKERDGK